MHFVVETEEGYREPTGKNTFFLHADPQSLCNQLACLAERVDIAEGWLQKWQVMDEIAGSYLTGADQNVITEGTAILSLADKLPDDGVLYSGNSMAIRDVDSFLLQTQKNVDILANRGANGIDGVVSSAAGAAAAGSPVMLVLGDLSFYHDMNGLLAAKHYNLNLTVLLVNNNGGGIFSFLPQASDEKYFEALFGTPLDIDFQHAAALYGADYRLAENHATLEEALEQSRQQAGISIIEVKTDRAQNAAWHREIWDHIIKAIKTHHWQEDSL
ncbi:thiamine pyrophosphate-dependent enzyme [Virgibacillus halophilus]|uniref:Thiamine pyrophosphate-dependent enzyme n=2 Tax=Tigheibacillus halophilus TaxID=361280 RepID=A0ABU5C339_9BACI|nr:thiamine pyrophosphate-dependent enzyme [Virgibacillus halophilus]